MRHRQLLDINRRWHWYQLRAALNKLCYIRSSVVQKQSTGWCALGQCSYAACKAGGAARAALICSSRKASLSLKCRIRTQSCSDMQISFQPRACSSLRVTHASARGRSGRLDVYFETCSTCDACEPVLHKRSQIHLLQKSSCRKSCKGSGEGEQLSLTELNFDKRWVVPYSPLLSHSFDCVEITCAPSSL